MGYPGQGNSGPRSQYPPAAWPGASAPQRPGWPTPPHSGGQPPYGFGRPPARPPRNRTPWVVGAGAAAISVLLLIVVTLYSNGAIGGGQGSYSAKGVDNACDLVDPAPLNRWQDQRVKTEHTETRADRGGGGSLRCLIRNQNFYDVVQLEVSAGLTADYAEKNYRAVKQSFRSSATIAEITDLGGQAYSATDPEDCFDSGEGDCLAHTLAVLDDNLNLKVVLTIETGAGRAINDTEVAQVARVYAERVMATLRK